MPDVIPITPSPVIYSTKIQENIDIASYSYISDRIYTIEKTIEALEREKTVLKHILLKVEKVVCKACKGRKRFWVHTSQDEGYWQECQACDGTGLETQND